MIVLLANDDLSRAHLVMDKMERLQNQVIGEPKVSALLRYLDLCITENSADAAIVGCFSFIKFQVHRNIFYNSMNFFFYF